MSDVPNSVPTPPAGWHPDPSGVNQLRYWDGSVWTHHVAPIPGSEPAPADSAAAYAPHADPAAAYAPYAAGAPVPPSRPPGQKVMTRATWIVLLITVLVVGGGIAALGWGAASATEAIESEAPDVATGFLDAVTTDDPAWADYASPGFVASFGSSTPLYGDASAAELIGLSVSYEAGELLYGEGGTAYTEVSPEGADSAKMLVDLTYSFTVDGAEQTATASQVVWLTRPYYYGDDVPSPVRDDAQPTAVGPWRVTGFVAPQESGDEPVEKARTSYQVELEGSHCATSQDVLVGLSAIARTEGYVPALCLSGGDTATFGENVDGAALGASFPVLTDAVPLHEEMGINPSYDVPAPLEQYRITAGDTDYVFVFATTGIGDALTEDSERRLISIEIAETR